MPRPTSKKTDTLLSVFALSRMSWVVGSVPAAGLYTRIVILVFVTVNGIVANEKFGSVDTVVPAHCSEATGLMVCATWLVPPAGSATSELAGADRPKSVSR